MKNRKESIFELQELQIDSIRKQKRGLHFIMASVFVWMAVLIIHLSALPIMTKNLFTFCCSAPLVLLAYLFSHILKIDFQNKGNPLSVLGLLFSLNQLLYILIAMWIYAAIPEKMLMVYAMIFGVHLLPYGWLYRSKSYYTFSVIIPVVVLLLGIYSSAIAIAIWSYVKKKYKLNMPFLVLSYPAKASALLSNAA